MNRLTATLLLLATMVPGMASAGEQIAEIKRVTGQVTIERDGQVFDAEVGRGVEQNDVLRTGANSVLGMVFTDTSRVSLGPDTEMSVVDYTFGGKGSADNAFDSRLTKGSLAAASGLIAKTPDAMRGTDAHHHPRRSRNRVCRRGRVIATGALHR